MAILKLLGISTILPLGKILIIHWKNGADHPRFSASLTGSAGGIIDLTGDPTLAASDRINDMIDHDTVDGRNPAPLDRWFIPLFIGFQPSKVMQDFFHPPYFLAYRGKTQFLDVSNVWLKFKKTQKTQI